MHIPFCVKKCAYCDFLSGPADDQTKRVYVDALVREMGSMKEKLQRLPCGHGVSGRRHPFHPGGERDRPDFSCPFDNFDISPDAEITMEVNPGTVSEEKAEAWKTCGINRLSIGLQSADDRELEMLGRIHTFEAFLDTWEIVRRAGFDNLNIDLISALPGQTPEGWEKTLRAAAELDPEHISAYSLIVEEGTPFYEIYGEPGQDVQARRADGQNRILPPLPDEDAEREIYQATGRILAAYGYHRYEISNYAKEGRECRHNLGYWDRKEYLGLGLGSASLIRECRFHNTTDMKKYVNIFGGAKGETAIRQPEKARRKIMRNLRSMTGWRSLCSLAFAKRKGSGKRISGICSGKRSGRCTGTRSPDLRSRDSLPERKEGSFLRSGGPISAINVFSEFIF